MTSRLATSRRRPTESILAILASIAVSVVWGSAVAEPASAQAQIPQRQLMRHHFHNLRSPPGVIGQEQLLRVPNSVGYYQPVEIRGPKGSQISLATRGGFLPDHEDKMKVGMLLGKVYRFRVGNIPLLEGYEVFPTVEVINRLHPPPGMAARFPIPIEITQEELEFALKGNMVTRVIYLEDPNNALAVAQSEQQPYFDVDRSLDPLHMADRMGRPMAILRMGSRVPLNDDEAFRFNSPPAVVFPEVVETKLSPPANPPANPPTEPATDPDSGGPKPDGVVTPTSGVNSPLAPLRQPGPVRGANPKRYPRLPHRYQLSDPR